MKKYLLDFLLILCLLAALLTACTDKPVQNSNPSGTLPVLDTGNGTQQSVPSPSEPGGTDPAGTAPAGSEQPGQPGEETTSSEGPAPSGTANPEDTEEPVESEYNIDIGTGSAVGGG